MSKTLIANPRSGREIDSKAHQLVQQFQPTALIKPTPFDIEAFFEFDLGEITGVSPDYGTLPWGIYGYTDSESRISIISAEMVEDPSQEKFARSTIAHECGHAVLHVLEFRKKNAFLKSFQHKDGMRLYRRDQIPTFQDPEWQAHRFAGGLLMPEVTVRMALADKASLSELSDIFNTSEPFVKSRLKGLGLLQKENGGAPTPPFSNGGQRW